MLCNLPVLLVHLHVFMSILSIVVSLVHDHISYAVNLVSCLNMQNFLAQRLGKAFSVLRICHSFRLSFNFVISVTTVPNVQRTIE